MERSKETIVNSAATTDKPESVVIELNDGKEIDECSDATKPAPKKTMFIRVCEGKIIEILTEEAYDVVILESDAAHLPVAMIDDELYSVRVTSSSEGFETYMRELGSSIEKTKPYRNRSR